MKQKHSCGTELSTLRFIEYDKKREGSKYREPVTDSSEWMWCEKCKKPVEVEVLHP